MDLNNENLFEKVIETFPIVVTETLLRAYPNAEMFLFEKLYSYNPHGSEQSRACKRYHQVYLPAQLN